VRGSGRGLILIAALLACALAASAAAIEDRMAAARAAYDKGDFAGARTAYEALAAEGWGGAALFYNLGNACEKTGASGRARLWYERSLAAAPSDEDARHNRDLVAAKLGLEEDPPDPLARWAGTLSLLFLGLNLVFFGWMAAGLTRRTEAVWWARWASGLLLVAVGGLALWARAQAAEPWAVALERLEARAAPAADAVPAFTAPEGQKVTLLQESGGWREIGLPSRAVKGWVPRDQVEPVRRP
jgi:tetratricopeptide (TPR) repeat protein